jgi:hypothetical protein
MGIIGDAATNVHAILQFLKQRVDGTIDDIHAVGVGITAENAQSLITYATQMEDGKGVQDKDMRQEKLIAWLFKIPPTNEVRLPQSPGTSHNFITVECSTTPDYVLGEAIRPAVSSS